MLQAFSERGFALFCVQRFFSGAGYTLQQAAIAWQVYEITSSTLDLGLVGVARFAPALIMSLAGGVVADRWDRRLLLLVALIVPFFVSLSLALLTTAGAITIAYIYALVAVMGLASAFEGPARAALLPQLVRRDQFSGAVTTTSALQQVAFVLGPVACGWAIAAAGIGAAYGVHVGLQAAAVIAVCFLPPVKAATRAAAAPPIELIKEGIHFVVHRPVLLSLMGLDMFAVIFAGATALLPVYAKDVLQVGPEGYGLLTSSQAVGALIASSSMIFLPKVQRTGRMLTWCVLGYGLTTIIFGLSRWFPLSLAAYALTGVFDQIGVVMRGTTIQLSTPDELRGRVSAVNGVFIGASNQLGLVESGLVAAATTPTFAVVSGGLACLAVLAVVTAKVPALWRYHIERDAEASMLYSGRRG